MTHMKYFEKYLTEATSVDDIDISVHCDIKIFEWLMKYLKQKDQNSTGEPASKPNPSSNNLSGGQTGASTNATEDG